MPDREALQEIERLLASPVRCPECREPVGWHPPAEHDAECFIGVALARVRALLAEPEPSHEQARAALTVPLEQPESPDQGSTASIGDPHGEVPSKAQ